MSVVPAASQALQILRFLARQSGPIPAPAIARELGLPRSTTYHLLDTLKREGFVVHMPEERCYGLGASAYELGSGYSRQASLQRLARGPVASLVRRTREHAHLAVLHGREVLYVVEERAPGKPQLVTDVGVRLPAHLTASGRAMLAFLTDTQIQALFPDSSALVRRNELGSRSLSELRQVIADVRRRGYAQDHGEVTRGFSSVSVAVFDHSSYPVASVTLTFLTGQFRQPELAVAIRQVARTAHEITVRFGGSGPPQQLML